MAPKTPQRRLTQTEHAQAATQHRKEIAHEVGINVCKRTLVATFEKERFNKLQQRSRFFHQSI